MSKRILKEAVAVSIKLVLHRFQDFRPLGLRALDYAIDVGKVYIQAHRASADGRRARVSLSHVGIFVGQHDVRIADLQLGVPTLPSGPFMRTVSVAPRTFL